MFTNTSAYDCVVILARNGETVASAPLATDVPPMESREYDLPFAHQARGGEYAVTLSFRLKADTAWAPRGYEVAFAQGVYRSRKKRSSSAMRRCASSAAITTRACTASISACSSATQGRPDQLPLGRQGDAQVHPEAELLARAERQRLRLSMPLRYAQWKIASLYAATNATAELAKKNNHPSATENPDGSVTIGYTYGLGTRPDAQCELTYTVHPCGQVMSSWITIRSPSWATCRNSA